jgi:UDPglucose 6-dehydrogenase
MKIAVIGTGYVGLVTGTCFAETGNYVTCIDIDKNKVKSMQDGQVPIYEPGLESLFHRNIQEGRLTFTTELEKGIKGAEIIFLALPTPPNEDGTADLSYILGVADQLGPILKRYTIIIDKSTVPVGTAERVRNHIKKNTTVEFDVVSNPEFLREGFAVTDFMKPDRIVIGAESDRTRELLTELYKPFVRQGNPIYFMDERSAEMTKYAANSFLATKISFMNEIANLCERVGADVDDVRLGIGADDRIGRRFLFPGIGYGGSCFPKDVLALHRTAMENDYDFKILEAVMDVNVHQKQRLTNKIMQHYKDNISGKKFALWGLAFKPDTDDVREAPALEIIKSLTAEGASVVAYDPEANANVQKLLGNNPLLTFTEDEYAPLDGADALIIATEWSVFRSPDFARMKKLLKAPLIFDGRNLYDLPTMQKDGFNYQSIGRRPVVQEAKK